MIGSCWMMLKRFCAKSGCKELVEGKYCEVHVAEEYQRYDRNRESSSKRGYNAKWRKARLQHLKANPLCVDCLEIGKIVPATDVDHIKPHKGDMVLFWDRNNWQSLCHSCHSVKTVREDGGFKR